MSIGAGLEDGRAVKDAYMKELVRKAYYREHKSKREIARELGIHRDTVSRLLKLEPSEIPKLQRKDWYSPVVGPYMAVIQAWLEMDALAPRKQQHTACHLHSILKLGSQDILPAESQWLPSKIINHNRCCLFSLTDKVKKTRAETKK